MKSKPSKITILHDTQEWNTSFENLKDVEINGEKIMRIHELAQHVNLQNKYIRLMAKVCTALCVGSMVLFLCIVSLMLKVTPDIQLVNQAFEDISDTNGRITYMIDVRPGNRGITTYTNWNDARMSQELPPIKKNTP